MSGCDKPIAGMGSFAGQKVVHPLARRRVPSLDRIKICCEDKNGPPPVGAWPIYLGFIQTGCSAR